MTDPRAAVFLIDRFAGIGENALNAEAVYVRPFRIINHHGFAGAGGVDIGTVRQNGKALSLSWWNFRSGRKQVMNRPCAGIRIGHPHIAEVRLQHIQARRPTIRHGCHIHRRAGLRARQQRRDVCIMQVPIDNRFLAPCRAIPIVLHRIGTELKRVMPDPYKILIQVEPKR